MVTDRRTVRRIALTGGIATGKSHVRARLEQLGAPTIDADILARKAVARGTPGFDAVVARFGAGVVGPDGELNRRALGSLVFSDPAARRALESIVHPAVQAATERWFASLDPGQHRFAIADIPLLFETGRDADFDAVILTTCAPATQVRRVMHRDGATEDEARLRIAAQLPVEQKLPRAAFVIDTDGSIEATNQQVDEVFRQLSQPGNP